MDDATEKTWITDDNGNRCSVEYWGSEEAARKALASLKNCKDCSDCSRCSGCSYCSGCLDCSGKKGESGDVGFPETPKIENIHSIMYAVASRPESLDMSSWHTCDNTHCRAGWAVTLAGEPGKKLEAFFNTELAAMLIYEASGHRINPARFYDSNAAALENMKRLADAEAETAP